MESNQRELEHKKRIVKHFESRTPMFIRTYSDDWIMGYLNEAPAEAKCFILDKKRRHPIPILYSEIDESKTYVGNEAYLPLPAYMAQEQAKEATNKLMDEVYPTEPKFSDLPKGDTK